MTIRLAAFASLLIVACSGEPAVEESANVAEPAPAPSPPPEPAEPEAAKAEAPVTIPEDAPGLAEMSPSRRRAWEKGYRDCSAGRYEPDPWPEAYRIGCAAAQDAQGE